MLSRWTRDRRATPKVHALSVAILVASMQAGAAEQEASPTAGSGLHIGGWVRTWASVNLQDQPETAKNDKGKLSMLRAALQLDASGEAGPVVLHSVARLDREYKTNYLKDLQTLGGGASTGNIMDLYNRGEIREAYGEFEPLDRLKLRLGKQQVVWGESDFFRGMDIVHGYDLRWRSFFEVENEDLRKPLVMLNGIYDLPQANGSLQVLVRPGKLNRDRDVGNTYDLSGGRWANQPNKGFDFLTLLNYDYRHPAGDTSKTTGGLRWSGVVGSVNYSFAYLQTYNNDPVLNSAFAPYQKAPTGAVGDLIYPRVNLIGATASSYVPAVDAVLSTELAYTKDAAFNVGSNFANGQFPGFGGIIRKDTLVTMLRMDKRVDLSGLIGAIRPSFLSIQLFDTWLPKFKREEDIVYLVGYGRPRKEHTTILTTILAMNYDFNNINPTIAAGVDLTNGGGFLIPSIEWVLGDKWRVKAELDLVFNSGQKLPGQVEQGTSLFGYFANNNQAAIRITRQF